MLPHVWTLTEAGSLGLNSRKFVISASLLWFFTKNFSFYKRKFDFFSQGSVFSDEQTDSLCFWRCCDWEINWFYLLWTGHRRWSAGQLKPLSLKMLPLRLGLGMVADGYSSDVLLCCDVAFCSAYFDANLSELSIFLQWVILLEALEGKNFALSENGFHLKIHENSIPFRLGDLKMPLFAIENVFKFKISKLNAKNKQCLLVSNSFICWTLFFFFFFCFSFVISGVRVGVYWT